ADTATVLAASAASAARSGAQSAAEAEAGELLVTGYTARANRAAAVELGAPAADVVAAALAEARTVQQLVADQVTAVTAALTAAQEARATAQDAQRQVLALPQSAAGVTAQADYAAQVVAAAGVSVDRATAALAVVQEAVAPVDNAVATLVRRVDRLDPASSTAPLPDAAAAVALGGVVVLGFGVAGSAAVSRRRSTVRGRVAAVRAGLV
ncbi:hypothetical protein, partial [Klenkia sp. PcliD-1-E]|uniref:hypothetical protein n=1 Tax=Klenkia sp. PcliD-1-E TaxID=2954492 RepID=UPI002097DC47